MLEPYSNAAQTTIAEGNYFGSVSNAVCGVYYPTTVTGGGSGGPAPGGCRIASFTTFDLFAKYTGVQNWQFTASVQNLFNRLPPFNPYTYGGVNYNPVLHQQGAIGKLFALGQNLRSSNLVTSWSCQCNNLTVTFVLSRDHPHFRPMPRRFIAWA